MPDLMMSAHYCRYILYISGGMLLYTYLLYPCLIWMLERVFHNPVKKADITPYITVLVPAHNEESHLRSKLENLLSLDYPKEKLNIVVASDGSTDRTAEIAREFSSRGVVFHEHKARRGKAMILNDEVPLIHTGIVVLADARQELEHNALRLLISNFADDSVGAASGLLVLRQTRGQGIGQGMGFYWKYETFIRRCESGLHSTVGATGALLAFRRELWRGLPPNTVVDDMVLPFQVVRQGRRVVLEDKALVYDDASDSWEREFVRKTRTLGGNFQILFHLASMGLPLFSPITFQFLSHKVARLLGPLALIGLFWSSHCLRMDAAIQNDATGSGVPLMLYTSLLAGQGLFYLGAILGFASEMLRLRIPLVHIPYGFMLTQVAIVCGFLRFGSGRNDVLWDKTLSSGDSNLYHGFARLVVDSTIFCLGLMLSFYVRYGGSPPEHIYSMFSALNPTFDFNGVRLAVPLLMLVPLSVLYFFHVNERSTDKVDPEFILNIIYGVFFSTVVVMLLIYSMRDRFVTTVEDKISSFPTAVIAISFMVNSILLSGWRLVWKSLRYSTLSSEGEAREAVVVAGGRFDPDLLHSVEDDPGTPTRISGVISPYQCPDYKNIVPNKEGFGLPDEIGADEIVCATGTLARQQVLDVVEAADKRGIMVAMIPGDLELLWASSKLRLISYIPVIKAGSYEMEEAAVFFKRAVDILSGFVGLVCNLPAMLLYIRKFGRNFSRSVRVGLRGNTFELLMPLPESRGSCNWVTFGTKRFLLSWHLLKADLSLIGPPALSERAMLNARGFEKSLLSMRPGIFGPRRMKISGESFVRRAFLPALYYTHSYNPYLDAAFIQECLKRRLKRLRKNKKKN